MNSTDREEHTGRWSETEATPVIDHEGAETSRFSAPVLADESAKAEPEAEEAETEGDTKPLNEKTGDESSEQAVTEQVEETEAAERGGE